MKPFMTLFVLAALFSLSLAAYVPRARAMNPRGGYNRFNTMIGRYILSLCISQNYFVTTMIEQGYDVAQSEDGVNPPPGN